jgi:hypothetical protein
MGHRHRRPEKQSLFAELLVVHNLVEAAEEKATISTAQRSTGLIARSFASYCSRHSDAQLPGSKTTSGAHTSISISTVFVLLQEMLQG